MNRRDFISLSSLSAIGALGGISFAQAQGNSRMYLVAHGAWSAGWAWKKMQPLLQAAGHRLLTPTYTGLGERVHLANPSVDLNTHIEDVANVIKYESLDGIVLIGHSYGGMVATGVADRVPERISRLIYLDAFVPHDGQALIDLLPEPARERMQKNAQANGGWLVPPNPIPGDTSPEDRKWIEALRMPTPLKCFTTKLTLHRGETKIPRAYIYCTRATPDDTFRPFAERAKRDGWSYRELDASHSPNVTAPEALAKLLSDLT